MVNASTASTRHARNTAMNSAEPLKADHLFECHVASQRLPFAAHSTVTVVRFGF
jgi:hypothetical protein